MKSIAKFYKVLFFACDGIVVPTVWGVGFDFPRIVPLQRIDTYH
jgi:hypothetical protein